MTSEAIAMLIDTEGCLHIGKQPPRGTHVTTTYEPKAMVTNTVRALLEPVYDLYGGSLHKVFRGGRHKDCYVLHINTRVLERLLNDIRPYLIVKKNQADVMFEFFALRRANPKRKTPGVNGSLPSSKEYLARQDECYLKIRKLNRRGNP